MKGEFCGSILSMKVCLIFAALVVKFDILPIVKRMSSMKSNWRKDLRGVLVIG